MSVTDQLFDSEGDGASFPLSSYAYDTLIEEVVSDDERDLEQQWSFKHLTMYNHIHHKPTVKIGRNKFNM